MRLRPFQKSRNQLTWNRLIDGSVEARWLATFSIFRKQREKRSNSADSPRVRTKYSDHVKRKCCQRLDVNMPIHNTFLFCIPLMKKQSQDRVRSFLVQSPMLWVVKLRQGGSLPMAYGPTLCVRKKSVTICPKNSSLARSLKAPRPTPKPNHK